MLPAQLSRAISASWPKHTAWRLQIPHHTEQYLLLCVQQEGLICSHIYQISSKPLQMFRKLLGEWQLNVATSWKVIPGFEAAHKKEPHPHPATPAVAVLLLADFFQDKRLRNGSIPHHSPIFLAWHAPFWVLTPKENWLGCCLARLPRKDGGWGEKEQSHLQGPFLSPPAVGYHCLVQGEGQQHG